MNSAQNKHYRLRDYPLSGEILDMLNSLNYKYIPCICDKSLYFNKPRFYESSKGYFDSTGRRWEIIFICPNCKKEWTYQQVSQKLSPQTFKN